MLSATSAMLTKASTSAPSAAASSTLCFETGSSTLKGQFHANEDRLALYPAPPRSSSAPEEEEGKGEGCLALMCDGHDGSLCAEFVSKHAFVPAFQAALGRRPGRGLEGEALSLKEAFAGVEGMWESTVERMKATSPGAAGLTSGACVTAALLRDDGQILSANVGDCRAVLRRSDGSIEVLTTDHRCSDPTEKERILRLGGFIRNNRVIGVLEPTRTIGDLSEKRSTNPGVISFEPDVFATSLLPSELPDDATVAMTISGLLEAAGQHQALALIPAGISGVGAGTGGGKKAGSGSGTSSSHRSQSASGQGRSGVGDAGGSTNAAAGKAARSAALAGQGHGSSSHYYGSSAASSATNLGGGRSSSASLSGVRKLGSGVGALLTPGMGLARTMLAASADPRSSGPGRGGNFGGRSSVVATFPSKPIPSFSLADAAATSPSLPLSFLVVATDGVWDVISTPSACAIVAHALACFGSAAAAARELVLMAKRYGSTDDISAVVVWIRKKKASPTTVSAAAGAAGGSGSGGLSGEESASATTTASTITAPSNSEASSLSSLPSLPSLPSLSPSANPSPSPSPYLSYQAAAAAVAGPKTAAALAMAMATE